MGKENFPDIYTKACIELDARPLTYKISDFSDGFNPKKNYAGLILYHHKGKHTWKNTTGVAKTHNCRSLYVLILCTDDWPTTAFKRAGQGMVHDYLYKRMFGRTARWEKGETCCGGFSIMQGELRYSSKWLNKQSNRKSKLSWKHDGHKELSKEEKTLVSLAVEKWKDHGPNSKGEVPKKVDDAFWRASQNSV